METWKARRFCETATIAQLREKIVELGASIEAGTVDQQDGEYFLRVAQEILELRLLFEP